MEQGSAWLSRGNGGSARGRGIPGCQTVAQFCKKGLLPKWLSGLVGECLIVITLMASVGFQVFTLLQYSKADRDSI